MATDAQTKGNVPVRGKPPARAAGADLGAWIRARRTSLNVNQRELADRAGISRSYLCDIERGRGTKPSVECLDSIATALGVERTELLREAGILAPVREPEENNRERKLIAVYRGLSEANQEALERFARFLLSEDQHWVQPRLVDGAHHSPHERRMPPETPTLFDAADGD